MISSCFNQEERHQGNPLPSRQVFVDRRADWWVFKGRSPLGRGVPWMLEPPGSAWRGRGAVEVLLPPDVKALGSRPRCPWSHRNEGSGKMAAGTLWNCLELCHAHLSESGSTGDSCSSAKATGWRSKAVGRVWGGGWNLGTWSRFLFPGGAVGGLGRGLTPPFRHSTSFSPSFLPHERTGAPELLVGVHHHPIRRVPPFIWGLKSSKCFRI